MLKTLWTLLLDYCFFLFIVIQKLIKPVSFQYLNHFIMILSFLLSALAFILLRGPQPDC